MGGFTNFPGGITSLGIPTWGVGGFIPPFTGKYFFVQETTTAGVSAGQGTAQQPFNTLTDALAQCVAGRNDVIFLTGTVHVTSAVTWSKNNVHLVGVCSPMKRGKRARVSVSGSTPFSNLFNVSASGCLFQNFGTFYGFPTVGATSPVCWLDTGGRNTYNLVEFLGFGDNTVSTGTANQTAARSFVLNTSTGETTWRSCVFGGDTLTRGAANYNLELAGGAPRLTFDDCDFEADIAAGGAGGGWLLVGASGIDRYVNFDGCSFQNSMNSGATAFTQGFNVNASAGGRITLDSRSRWYGATHLETSASNCVYSAIPVFDTVDAGLTSEVVPS